MDDNFMFDDKESKGIWKIVLISAAVILGAGGLLGVLIGSSITSDYSECIKVSDNTKIPQYRCEGENRFKQIIFVVGDTANTPKPILDDNNSKIINSMFDSSKNGKKDLYYISVSKPKDTPRRLTINKHGAEDIRKAVLDQIGSSYATVDGADYLEAIRNAAFYAKDKDNTLIYVVGSGLSDNGLLNFADTDLLGKKYSVDDIIKAFSTKIEDKSILNGLTVFWEGIGNTTFPQESLGDSKNKLVDIYQAVLMEYGLDQSDFIVSKDSSDERNEQVKTKVKTVKVAEEDNVIIDLPSDSSELAFIPGTAIFRDENAAGRKIQDLVNKYGDAVYTIKPFQSRGMCDKAEDTSLLDSRANATKQLFVKAGVSESDIRIEKGEIGDANECPRGVGHYSVDENEAQKNRKVRISVKKK